jgi:hypothetical protein
MTRASLTWIGFRLDKTKQSNRDTNALQFIAFSRLSLQVALVVRVSRLFQKRKVCETRLSWGNLPHKTREKDAKSSPFAIGIARNATFCSVKRALPIHEMAHACASGERQKKSPQGSLAGFRGCSVII